MDSEYRDLRERYPCEYQKLLDQLSIYMRSSGRMYQDHYATLLLWAGRNTLQDDDSKYDCGEGECL
ncbi:MAG: hypothetical protein Q4F24_17030 [Eubacteriales bacterium]|nr:hypothetical protein [Eubacteriales bacterium]